MYICNSKTVKWRGGETFAIVLRSKHYIIYAQHFVRPSIRSQKCITYTVQWWANIDGQSAVSTISRQSDGGHRCSSTVHWYMNTAQVRNNLHITCWEVCIQRCTYFSDDLYHTYRTLCRRDLWINWAVIISVIKGKYQSVVTYIWRAMAEGWLKIDTFPTTFTVNIQNAMKIERVFVLFNKGRIYIKVLKLTFGEWTSTVIEPMR